MKIKVEKIRRELKRLGWSQADLARELGVSKQALSYWLQRTERLKMLDRIARALQVEARDLIE